MDLLVKKQKFPVHLVFFFLFAVLALYLVQLQSIMQIVAFLGFALLIAISALTIKRYQYFFMAIIVIKPYIDLTWNYYFFSFGGKDINALDLTGVYVFLIVGYLYFFERDKGKIFNEGVIWIYIGLNIFSSFYAAVFKDYSIMRIIDMLIKLVDGYFIYFIFHKFMKEEKIKLRIFFLVWISTLSTGVLSLFVYLSGSYYIDITSNVVRFTGVYHDPGTPAYNAIISLVFGTLYLELTGRKKTSLLIHRLMYIFTIFVTLAILALTITKSAILMLIVFLIFWFGLYKKKLYLIIPLIVVGIYFVYTTSGEFQMRMADEVDFFKEGEFTVHAARGIGTGRVAVWERAFIIFGYFSPFQKLFGSAGNFGAHNQYIAYLMQIGIIGLSFFLIILYRFYKRLNVLYRKYKDPGIFMALTLLAIFIVYGMTGHPFDYTTFLWYLMILLSVINLYENKPSRRKLYS